MNDEQVLEKLATEPALDKKTMYRMEEAASDNNTGINRRVMLASLTTSLEDLVESRLSNPEVFASMKDCVGNFLAHAEAAHETAKTAMNRLSFADRCGKEPIEA